MRRPDLSVVLCLAERPRPGGAADRSVASVRGLAGAGIESELVIAHRAGGAWERASNGPATLAPAASDGPADLANAGVAAASGRYVVLFWPGDRLVAPGVAAALSAAGEQGRPGVIVGRGRFEDEAGGVCFDPGPPEPVSAASLLSLSTRWFAGRGIVRPAALVRRDVWLDAGGWSSACHPAEDHEFWLRLARRGERFALAAELVGVQLDARDRAADANLVLVEALLRHCEPAFASVRPGLAPPEADAVARDLARVRAKASVARLLVDRWRASDPGAARANSGGFGAISAHADACADALDRWSAPRQALAAPSRRAMLARAGRELRGPLRVLCVAADAGAAAADAIACLGRRRVRAVAAVFGDRAAALARAAAIRGAGPVEIVELRREADLDGLGSDGPFDLVVAEAVLHKVADPAELLARLIAMARPGGFVLVAAEPSSPAPPTDYLRGVERRVCDLITLDGALVLDPEADEHLAAVEDEHARLAASWPAGSTGSAAIGAWRRAIGHPAGLDPEALAAGVAEVIDRREFGSLWHLPRAPFPLVGDVLSGGRDPEGWFALLLRRRHTA